MYFFLNNFFGKTIPGFAGRAFTKPFGRLMSAALTEKVSFSFCHE
jgi:hypothetical protein